MLALLLGCMVLFVASGMYHSYREWRKEEREAEERTEASKQFAANLRWVDGEWYHGDTPIRYTRQSDSELYETITHTC